MENETIVIELNCEDRIELYGKITSAMKKMGYESLDYGSLDLGFELPVDWPVGSIEEPCEITLAQLTIIAVKLKMKMKITGLDMEIKT